METDHETATDFEAALARPNVRHQIQVEVSQATKVEKSEATRMNRTATYANLKEVPSAEGTERARPNLHQQAIEIQPFGKIAKLPIALDETVCVSSVQALNQVLADTMILRDMYKKHHWQVAGGTFYQLHLLFDKHYGEQAELIDALAERIQILGGISLAMGIDAAETSLIPRPPRGREEAPVQISRLLEAHEFLLRAARAAARQTAQAGDDGTNDLLVSQVIRTNEFQVWFLAEHLVNISLAEAD
jgi:starvation-inducible DNA-binding protein